MDNYRFFVGDGVVTLMNRALPEDKRNNDIVQICVKTFREEYGKSWNVKTRPYDGVSEMLDAGTATRPENGGSVQQTGRIHKTMVTEYLPKWAFGIVLGQRNSLPLKPDPSWCTGNS